MGGGSSACRKLRSKSELTRIRFHLCWFADIVLALFSASLWLERPLAHIESDQKSIAVRVANACGAVEGRY